MACPGLRSATSQAPLLVAASLIFWAIVRVLQVYYAGWGSGFDVGIYRTYAQLWGAGGAPYVDFQPEYPPGALPVFLFPYLVGGVEHYPDYFALSMAVFDVIAMLLVLFQVRGECTARTTGNRKGWRLPSVHELASLMHPSVPPPGPALQPGHPFLNFEPLAHLSATTNAEVPTFAWFVQIANGVVNSANKSSSIFAWCVRGGMNADVY